jgi:integrase
VRPGELRTAEWADIDLDGAEWRYTVSKTGTAHIAPLALQAVAALREIHALTGTGGSCQHRCRVSSSSLL